MKTITVRNLSLQFDWLNEAQPKEQAIAEMIEVINDILIDLKGDPGLMRCPPYDTEEIEVNDLEEQSE